ncbi:MAG: hypothetical protein ACXVB9_02365 [Bdellovibrionota bacterium]
MSTQKIEVRLNEKEAAHYFSNAAALYVLGMGFGYFAIKAQTPFMTGVCFWFSVYLLCDCFRLARVCGRLEKNNNVLLVADEKGFTHYVSWLEPEFRAWGDITSFRQIKGINSETVFFQSRVKPDNMLRFALFGAPKFDLPLSCLPGGKEGLLKFLSSFPEAKHLVPERANEVIEQAKAA